MTGKMEGTVKRIAYLFAIVGLLFASIGGYWAFNTKQFLKTALTAQGEVIDMIRVVSSDSTTYKPKVQFNTQDGQMIVFESSQSSNPPAYRKGEKVTMFYSPSDPYESKIDGWFSLWGFPVVFGGMGSIFFCIGGGMIYKRRKREQAIEYLKVHGMPVVAQLESVVLNESFSVNNVHPYQIQVKWTNPRSQQVTSYKSDNIWYDPSSFIEDKEITVLIDRNDESKYYVDLSFLPTKC